MNVGELREKLKQYPSDAEVWVRGTVSEKKTFVHMSTPASDLLRLDPGFYAGEIVAITLGK